MKKRLPVVRIKKVSREEFNNTPAPERGDVSEWVSVVQEGRDVSEGALSSWFADFDGDTYKLYMNTDGCITELDVEGTNFLELDSDMLLTLATHLHEGEGLRERMQERWEVLYDRGLVG